MFKNNPPKFILSLLITFFVCSAFTGIPKATAATVVNLNGNDTGRIFQGVGGVSAGASSELLIDYPEPYRSEILDYLFRPKFGASMQQLKVEIGCDACVVGAESSHARTIEELANPQAQYYQRGYEYWLMRMARDRNPNIYLGALEWAVPRYTGGHWTQTNADYLVRFIKGAQEYWNLNLDYISPGRNEGTIDLNWLKNTFKPTLDAAGLSAVKILAPDDDGDFWGISNPMESDPQLKNIVDMVGYHYICGHLPSMSDESRAATTTAKNSGKILVASEDWSTTDGSWPNAHLMAGILNKFYIRDRVTMSLLWDPIDSYYNNLAWSGTGVMRADTPWSGYYEVEPAVWAMAHTTQFNERGWQYLDGGCGYFGTPSGGNYVALKKPGSGDYSIIIYTDGTPQTLTVNLSGGLSTGPVHVWKSNSTAQFIQQNDLTPVNSSFIIALDANSIYSLTTTTGQTKGVPAYAIPANSAFPFPYTEDYESYSAGISPRYHADIAGGFEVADCGGGRNGKCLRQMVTNEPYDWEYAGGYKPNGTLTEFGNQYWGDYQVAVDVLVENSGYAQLFAHLNVVPGNSQGYYLRLYADGTWQFLVSGTVIAQGTISGGNQWHNLKITCDGSNVTAAIDQNVVANAVNTIATGMIGLGSSWDSVEFDNVTVQPVNPNNPIVDNDSTGCSFTGVWTRYTGEAQAYGGSVHYAEKGDGSTCATFTPDLPQAGNYQVYAWWSALANRATDAPYTIYYNGGNQLVRVNQEINGGQWNLLGTFNFTTGTSGSVKLTNNANEYVIADAVKFEYGGGNSPTPTPTPISSPTPTSGTININDNTTGTGNNQFDFTGNWGYGSQSGAYQNDNHWSNTTNDYYLVRFNGSRIRWYACKAPNVGIAGISIDGSLEANVDQYASSRTDNVLLYDSGVLAIGQHTLKVRVTGTKNAGSTGTFISADRVEITNGGGATPTPTPTPVTVSVNDNTTGTGNNQFDYTGNWSYGIQLGAYQNDNHWSDVTNDFYQVRFTGTQIKWYACKGPNLGIAALSIDGGTETIVDQYAASRSDNVLLYTSPVLTNGPHILKVRVTGTKNTMSIANFISADRVDLTGIN